MKKKKKKSQKRGGGGDEQKEGIWIEKQCTRVARKINKKMESEGCPAKCSARLRVPFQHLSTGYKY